MATLPKFLIVDGHSVIFAWPELRAMHNRKTFNARSELVKILTGYQDHSGVRVVAVFDGQGKTASNESQLGGIQVFYSASGQTADTVIERLVAKYVDRCDILVATSDHLEQETIYALGAQWISAEELHTLVSESEKEFSRFLKDYQKKR